MVLTNCCSNCNVFGTVPHFWKVLRSEAAVCITKAALLNANTTNTAGAFAAVWGARKGGDDGSERKEEGKEGRKGRETEK